jgi:hypothetical protein
LHCSGKGNELISSSSSVPLAAALPIGAREGAADVAEHLALDQARRQGAAIDHQERLLPARRELMDQARQPRLAGAGLAGEKDGGVLRGDAEHLLAEQRHLRGRAVEVVVGIAELDGGHVRGSCPVDVRKGLAFAG